MEKASIPGIYSHFALRKRCITEYVEKAVKNGARQLIVIGGGFDTLSLQIAKKYAAVKVLEIDHPATQSFKLKVLKGSKTQVQFLGLDLSKSTKKDLLLKSTLYSGEVKSVFVAEGLTMYIREKELEDILTFVRDESGPKSQFIFTYMQEQAPDNFQFHNASSLTNIWLKLKGESFTWGARKEHLEKILETKGFDICAHIRQGQLRRKYLGANSNVKLAAGENIMVAQRRSNGLLLKR